MDEAAAIGNDNNDSEMDADDLLESLIDDFPFELEEI